MPTRRGIGLRKNDRELFSTSSARNIDRSAMPAHADCHLSQDLITGGEAKALIDQLEVVNVNDEQRKWPAIALGAHEFLLEPVVEVSMGVEAGQVVGNCQLLQLAHQCLKLSGPILLARVERLELVEHGSCRYFVECGSPPYHRSKSVIDRI
ncbi:MAG: hypothetical protein DCC49_03610 [Acidobacteria bacterium]|nr:MAG: hypothetical protein DCC49_03610 [Acidobacteriota bacterium]